MSSEAILEIEIEIHGLLPRTTKENIQLFPRTIKYLHTHHAIDPPQS